MISARRILIAASVLASAGILLVAGAATGTSVTKAPGKPVIGNPATVPAQPRAGKPFTVSFRVTKAGTGRALLTGRMMCDPSIAGTVIRHAESFTRGIARLSFVVPADAAGKVLKVKVTITAAKQSTTKVAAFRVKAVSLPSVAIDDVSMAEGDSGTTTLSFPVRLSAPATQVVSVGYSTADGTAVTPSDYAAASGTVTFQPGETAKAIAVGAVGDTTIEQDETLNVTVADPVNATLGRSTATGTITNDDTAVPVTAGVYLDPHGNYVYLTVLPDRTVTGFRTNSLTESCNPGNIYLQGSVSWGTDTFPIADNGNFTADGSWSGSDKVGDTEYTKESWQVTGVFDTATSVHGTFVLTDELNYKDTHFQCSTGTLTYSATLQK